LTEVRKFGLLFGGICALAAGYCSWKGTNLAGWFAGGAVFFVVTGLFIKPVLRPIYTAWMAFARVLAWVNTRLLLGVFFYLVLTPLGLVMRLFGKDFLDERIDRSSKSYWIMRKPAPLDKARCERLF
jgi:hypothetical protein